MSYQDFAIIGVFFVRWTKTYALGSSFVNFDPIKKKIFLARSQIDWSFDFL